MNEKEIESLSENARKNLSQAQFMCQDSHSKLSLVKMQINKLQQDRSKLEFIMDCLSTQGRFLYNGMLLNGIGKQLIEHEWSQEVLENLVHEMEHWQSEILQKVQVLDRTEYKLSKGEGSRLGDFISRDNLHTLDAKLKEVPVIKGQIENIKVQYHSMVNKVRDQLLENRLEKLRLEFQQKFSLKCKDLLLLSDKYPQEITRLEQDLVDFLKSLTDHFDKCNLMGNKKLPSEDREELFEIVSRDDGELTSIMSELQEAVCEVDSLTLETNDLLRKKEDEKQKLKSAMLKISTEFEKHEEYISVFQGISDLIQTFKTSCKQDMHQVKELCQFYSKFKQSYQNLLKEVERRQDVALRMTEVLRSCEKQLQELNLTDIKERQLFLLNNGDYLPENIWPGEIDDLSPLFTLEYSLKEI